MTDVLHRFILAPTLGGISAIERWGQSNIVSLFRGPRLASENAALRAQVAVLTQQSRALRDDADENARLRVLLKFEEHSPRRLLPAEVLALKPFAQRDSAIFSRGARSGVGVKQVALGPNGALVGQVTGVTQTTCDVMLLTDALSSVGAQVLPDHPAPPPLSPSAPAASYRESNHAAKPVAAAPPAPKAIIGVCVGDRSPVIELTDLPPDAAIHVGDRVVTSGLGGIYPKSIPIGRITRVSFDQTRYLKSASVTPDADLDHLEEGFLIR